MLKKMCGLFLGLVVLTGSACVTPTHASSAHEVIITYVQAGGATGAKEELVVLYNTTSQDIDVSNWCFVNKSDVTFACFDPLATEGELATYTLPAYGYVTVASEEYTGVREYPDNFYSLIFAVTNQSSGSIVGSSGSVLVVDGTQEVVANKSWTNTLSSGKAWVRMKLISEPDVYAVGNEQADWVLQDASIPPPSDLIVNTVPHTETIPDPEELIPFEGYLPPIITELLPNPAGADAGREYIELYNPNTLYAIPLNDVQLRIGFEKPKWHSFSPAAAIPPQSYVAFFNNEVNYSLTNTAGKVQLFWKTQAIGDAIEYSSAKDDQAWALISGAWQYTRLPTPGEPNMPSPEVVSASKKKTSTLKPCASNQYRSPETNRCRLISAASTSPKPCKAGQYRNPETNRCRSVAGATSTLKPCTEGQERNPETNRCRNIVKMTNAEYEVKPVEEVADNQPSWYYWLGIILVVGLALTYAVWEWREELRELATRAKGLVTK